MNEAKLNLRLTGELLEAGRREAERRGLTLSDWIRGLMAEAVAGPLLPSSGRRGQKRRKKGARR